MISEKVYNCKLSFLEPFHFFTCFCFRRFSDSSTMSLEERLNKKSWSGWEKLCHKRLKCFSTYIDRKKSSEYVFLVAQQVLKWSQDDSRSERFGLVWFYGLSTIVSYLMPNPFNIYILNIYDFVWLRFTAYQPL